MDKTKNFWDKASKSYDTTEERFEHIHSRARENTKRYLKATDTVLDYGCGTGTASCELAHLVEEIRAIDISPQMIEFAKSKGVANKIENVSFMQGTIFDAPLESESFDVVLAFNMLHTVPNPKSIVQRVYEVLKPGGLFISITPCMQEKKSISVSMQIFVFRLLLKIGLVPISFEFYKSSDLDELINTQSFQVIESEKVFKGATSYFAVAKKMSE